MLIIGVEGGVVGSREVVGKSSVKLTSQGSRVMIILQLAVSLSRGGEAI